jgi:hypothetical protein
MKPFEPNKWAHGQFNVSSAGAEELTESIKFFPHDRLLRSLGLLLQQAGFSEFELRVSGAVYTAYGQVAEENASLLSLALRFLRLGRAGHKRRTAMRELQYSIGDILNCETESRQRRKQPSQMPDPFSVSQILRGIGRYLDQRKSSQLIGVKVKDRSVTIDYETAGGLTRREIQDFEYFYNYWVKMYLQRSNRAKLPPPSDPTLYLIWECSIRQHRLSRAPN